MKSLLNRIQVDMVKRCLGKFPVTAVIGARQVGKTTLVRELLGEERPFFTLDDPAVIGACEENPISFLTQYPRMTIDEVQKSPSLLLGIKRIVDQKRIPGQFLLTGSANITMLPKISETLAGRIAFVEVSPLTITECFCLKPKIIEVISSKTSNAVWEALNDIKQCSFSMENAIFRGGYPTAWLERDNISRQEWFKGYIRTYLERDVRDLSRIQKLYDYQRFLSLASFRSAQILNHADLSRDSGISYTTARGFFNLLLATFQVFLIVPYFRNIGKRLIKSPKLMWADTGLAIHLQGLNTWADIERLGRTGFFVENKIAIEIKALLSAYLPLCKLFYWRTSAGCEIDLLIEHNGGLIPIEVKWKERVTRKDIFGIKGFFEDFKGDVPWGMVLYRGKSLLRIGENIFLVPFEYLYS